MHQIDRQKSCEQLCIWNIALNCLADMLMLSSSIYIVLGIEPWATHILGGCWGYIHAVFAVLSVGLWVRAIVVACSAIRKLSIKQHQRILILERCLLEVITILQEVMQNSQDSDCLYICCSIRISAYMPAHIQILLPTHSILIYRHLLLLLLALPQTLALRDCSHPHATDLFALFLCPALPAIEGGRLYSLNIADTVSMAKSTTYSILIVARKARNSIDSTILLSVEQTVVDLRQFKGCKKECITTLNNCPTLSFRYTDRARDRLLNLSGLIPPSHAEKDGLEIRC